MPTIDEQISALKAQGKSESTSKSLAKLVKAKASSGGNTAVYGKTGLSSPTSSSSIGGSTSGGSTIDRALQLQREAVKPAVASLEAGIPEVQQQYATQRSQLEAEKAPLQQRYDDLISQIKGNQTSDNSK
jgi:hypothetical protein